jgi:GNAT superfamily N-acetyltransferase
MVHRRAPDRPSKGIDVRELDLGEQHACAELWLQRDTASHSPDVIRQLCDSKRVWAEAVLTRFFAAFVDGEPASMCDLALAPPIGEIEDVRTLEQHRGRGLARAVVLRAVAEAKAAGCDLVFLVAEDDDWPKEVYRKLGFDPVGRTFVFVRKPKASSGRAG